MISDTRIHVINPCSLVVPIMGTTKDICRI
nr:MAG TPA: hypothetical protein [Caudoviricetes sp.]